MEKQARTWAVLPYTASSLEGHKALHLAEIQLRALLSCANAKFEPVQSTLDAVVLRAPNGSRVQPVQVSVSEKDGLVGDRWSLGKANLGDQVSMMNLDVAHAFANGQSVVLFGDNLFTRLDLSTSALPIGAQLKIGPAVFEVSATPHVPCGQFRSRFGSAAFRLAAKEPRLRGVYLTVMKGGDIRIGDAISVVAPIS